MPGHLFIYLFIYSFIYFTTYKEIACKEERKEMHICARLKAKKKKKRNNETN